MSPNRSLERPAPPEPEDDRLTDEDAATIAQVNALLPEIDEDDPEFQAYMRAAVQEALDDPRPSVPMEEAFARLDRRFEEEDEAGLR